MLAPVVADQSSSDGFGRGFVALVSHFGQNRGIALAPEDGLNDGDPGKSSDCAASIISAGVLPELKMLLLR